MKARIPKNAKPIINASGSKKMMSVLSDEEMTDEVFWKKLDSIAEKTMSIDIMSEFLEVLAEGYSQDLKIPVMGVYTDKDKDLFKQNCIIDNGEKIMLYFTDQKYVEACMKKIKTPAGSEFKPEYIPAYARDVIDNAIEQDEVKAIVFNYGSENQFVIPKLLLTLKLLKYADD